MVNVSEYKGNGKNYINVKEIEGKKVLERRAVIISGGEMREFTVKTDGIDKTVHKPVIVVEFNGKPYDFSLSKENARTISNETLSEDTDKWVGTVLQFDIDDSGRFKYVRVTVIDVPKVK